jgi:hypothetical protein
MFRFTIRELVLLTLVVSMGVGWWVDRRKLIEAYDPQTRLETTVFRVHDSEKIADVALGYDDGVATGDRLDVYRRDVKIGEIKLREIKPDTSRGAISKQDVPIQKGDKACIYLRRSDFQRHFKVGLR